MFFYEPGSGPLVDIESASAMTLDFPAFKIVKNKLFINHLVYGILLEQLDWAKILPFT